MEKFTFTSESTSSKKDKPQHTFNGPNFYHAYKDSEFLRIDTNIETLLERGYELRQKLKSIQDGEMLLVDGMNLERNSPLLIKKTGPKTKVEDYEFTYNRLMGLTAAYVFENRQKFPRIRSSEPQGLGLVWDQNDYDKCKLYLSAVSGTEYMIHCFSFWPLICGLRKFQVKNLPAELVIKMGNIKNAKGVTMAKVLKSKMPSAKVMWMMFPEANTKELETLINDKPEFKCLFQD